MVPAPACSSRHKVDCVQTNDPRKCIWLHGRCLSPTSKKYPQTSQASPETHKQMPPKKSSPKKSSPKKSSPKGVPTIVSSISCHEDLQAKKPLSPPAVLLSYANAEWRVGKQLGKSGKEGTVYLVTRTGDNNNYAMKEFKKTKSIKTFNNEVEYQRRAANVCAAPRVVDVISSKPPRLIMDMTHRTIQDVLDAQCGNLTDEQQWNIVRLCQRLDNAKVYQNDPNPLNLMETFNGDFVWIDYGYATTIDTKKHGSKPNTRALNTLLHGAMQGLVPRKIYKGNYSILQTAIDGAKKENI